MTSEFANLVAASPVPPSMGDDKWLWALNLFLFSAFTYIMGGSVISRASAIWSNRRWDRWNHPVTLHRLAWLFASSAAFTRCAAEAARLYAWADRSDVATILLTNQIKSYVDPVSLVFAAGWLVLLALANQSMEEQLRRQPFPVRMWARLPELTKPAILVVISGTMALGVVYFQG